MFWFKARGFTLALLLCFLLFTACAAAHAQSFSHVVSFQGRLCDPDTGKPQPDGQYQVTFTIYDADAEGNALWQEAQDVTQTGGVFNVLLGTVTPFPSDLFTDGNRWLSLQVSGDGEMPERFPFTPTPWALHAANSDKVDGFDASSTPAADHLLALDEDAELALEAIPQGEGSGLDSDTVDGYHAEDLMGPGGDFVELAPDGPQTGATVDLIGSGAAPTMRLENGGLALVARTTAGEWVSAWKEMGPPTSPTARASHAMAYDAESDCVMLFGGTDGYGDLDDTWAYNYDADTWTRMSPPSSPTSRRYHAVAYDAESDRVILFGGIGGLFDDTWAYDFNTDTWTQMDPPSSPPARYAHAMAYDAESDRLMLFGGNGYGGDLGDTWAYDFNTDTWTEMSPPNSPSGGRGHAMAYDGESDQVVLFGGLGEFDDTWAYDYNTNTWTQMNPADHPSARRDHQMAYDAESHGVMLFGGYGYDGYLGDTWVYNYNTDSWMQMNPPTSPSARSCHAIAYDAGSDRAILFGGMLNGRPLMDDTWALSSYNAASVAEFEGSVRVLGDLTVGGMMFGTVENAYSADKVDGFDASQTPTPDTILPLDAQGKIPVDVIEGPFPPDDDWIVSGDNVYRLTGNVGVGTATPTEKLAVEGNLAIGNTGSSSYGIQFRSRDDEGLFDTGAHGLHLSSPEQVVINIDSNNNGGACFFRLARDAATGSPTSANTLITVTEDGKVGIGIYGPNDKLEVNGKVKIYDWYTSGAYDVQVTSGGGLARVSSSRRYKKDIGDLEAIGSDAFTLRPVRFRWKETGDPDIGLIAEEVAELIPDLVVYDEQGRPDAVKYDKLALYLLAAMKELKAENEALKQRIVAVERRN